MRAALLRTLSALRHRWYLIIPIVLFDILFLYAFGKTYAVVFTDLSQHLDAINQLLQQSIGTFTQTSDPSALQLGVADFNAEVSIVQFGIVKILTSLLGFWALFQGGTWFCVHRIVGFSRGFVAFLWRFIVATIAGWLAFVGILSGILYLSFKAFSSVLPLIGQSGINVVAGVASLLVLYLLFVAYAVIGEHLFLVSFVSKLRKGGNMLAFVFLILMTGVLYQALTWIGQSSVPGAFAFGAFVVLPVFVVLRVYFVESVRTS